MIEERPLTDKALLLQTLIDNNEFELPIEALRSSLDYIADCVEYLVDGKVAGWIVLMDVKGEQSIHGYKLVKGYAWASYCILRRFIAKYPCANICLNACNKKVICLIRMLGFRAVARYIYNHHTIYTFERSACLSPQQ